MAPLVLGKARKASSTQQTFRKQAHGPARPGSRPDALARQSTHPSISQSVQLRLSSLCGRFSLIVP